MTAARLGSTARAVAVAVAVVLVAVGLAAGMALGTWLRSAAPAAAPDDGSVDAGFARAMKDHHAQAVQMATLIRDRTSDPQVRTLALDILLTQQQQIGQMYGWLTAWQLPQTSARPPMAWMGIRPGNGGGSSTGHQMGQPSDPGQGQEGALATMPGMATAQEVQRLAELPDRRAQRLFLTLMIRHHRGGVTMARAAADQASQPTVRGLARSIVASQTAEITALQQMLAARGGPLP